jgi:hypothetical protein
MKNPPERAADMRKFYLESISKMSFGPISLLVPRFKSSTYNSMLPVCDPQRLWDQKGNPATRATHLKIIKSVRNPAKLEKLDPAAILNQNPIFEMGSRSDES